MPKITEIPQIQRIADRAISWIEDVLNALRQWRYERDPSNKQGNYLDKFVARDELVSLGFARVTAGGQLAPYAAMTLTNEKFLTIALNGVSNERLSVKLALAQNDTAPPAADMVSYSLFGGL